MATVQCQGSAVGGGGTVNCVSGSSVVLSGAHFGANATAVSVGFSEGQGPVPVCMPLEVRPRVLSCGLSGGPQTLGVWRMALTVRGVSVFIDTRIEVVCARPCTPAALLKGRGGAFHVVHPGFRIEWCADWNYD